MSEPLPSFEPVIRQHPALKCFLLFGSQAMHRSTPTSDWDFGYLADDALDSAALRNDLALLLHSDSIDLVNLAHANGLLRFIAAQGAHLLYEKTPHEYGKFWHQTVNFWCDHRFIFHQEYKALLERL